LAQKVNRPIGVTIIAILTIIIGIIAIFGGISLVAFGAFLSVTPIGLTNNNNGATTTEDSSSQLVVQVFGVSAAIVGAILLAIGVVYIYQFSYLRNCWFGNRHSYQYNNTLVFV
jgi:drug/metabolite transporter (DMT)-like permease